MRVIYWVGGIALVSAITISAWLAVASTGDAIIRRVDTKVLTGAQKTALVNAIKCDVPAFVATGVSLIACEVVRAKDAQGAQLPDVWTCRTRADVTMTEAAYVVAHAHGTVGTYTSRAAGNVTAPAISDPVPISSGCLSGWDTWLGTVYSGATLGATERFHCARHLGTPSQIDCSATRFVTLSPAAYLNAGGGTDDEPQLVGVVE